jgi:hypothetical protein
MNRLIKWLAVGLLAALLVPSAPASAEQPYLVAKSASGVTMLLVDGDDADFEDNWEQAVREAGAALTRAPAGCADYWDRPSHTFTDRKDVYVRVHIAYRRCLPSYDNTTYAFLKVNYVVAAYNVDGASMSCDPVFRYLNGVEFNMRFYQPYRGTSFNPGAFTVVCDETTINSEMQNYSWEQQPRLYYGPGSGSDRQPMWNVYVKVNRRADNDLTWQKSQDFNLYS